MAGSPDRRPATPDEITRLEAEGFSSGQIKLLLGLRKDYPLNELTDSPKHLLELERLKEKHSTQLDPSDGVADQLHTIDQLTILIQPNLSPDALTMSSGYELAPDVIYSSQFETHMQEWSDKRSQLEAILLNDKDKKITPIHNTDRNFRGKLHSRAFRTSDNLLYNIRVFKGEEDDGVTVIERTHIDPNNPTPEISELTITPQGAVIYQRYEPNIHDPAIRETIAGFTLNYDQENTIDQSAFNVACDFFTQTLETYQALLNLTGSNH